MIYKDERGEIADVAEMDFKSLQIITSKKGSVRSNHYHEVGGHLLYVVSGEMRYLERPTNTEGDVVERIVNAGESVYTGPMMTHKTEFLEDTVLVCCATVLRSGTSYAEDTIRDVLQ